MYSKILSDINQPYYKNNFENDGQRFVAWYLRNIHNLDTYQTKDCLTDGANDKQIDAVYIVHALFLSFKENFTKAILLMQNL